MFFLSGIAALIYQIVWAKELTLVFGVTLYATSAVVATFMAGLALGSLYFGRLVDRWQRPLVLFALLEVGIAAFAPVFPGMVVLLRRAYVVFYGPFGDNYYVMSLVRFVMAFLVLIVPTSLMGGTLPVIIRAYVVGGKRLGRDVASLYSANNIGAFIGCVAAGYVLLEIFGPTGTLRLAALLNFAVVAMALSMSRRPAVRPAATPSESDERATGAAEPSRLSRPVKVALWVFGLEGVASLIYQMAWLRMLIFFVRMDIFGVTAIVSTFLMGLSLGAFLCRRWVDRLRNPYRALGIIEIGIGLTALATIPVLPFLLGIHNAVLNLPAGGLPLSMTFSAANFAVTFLVILVPTAFMGATLPVVSRIYVGELRGLGRKMGVLGCLDTVGSIFGAFAGGFLLIPLVGVQRTIIATALLNLALAGWVFAADPLRRRRLSRRPAFVASVVALLAAASLLLLEPAPLIKYSHVLTDKPILELVQYEEDQVASASVVEQKGFGRFLYVNDHVVAGDFRHDRPSHELMLHVPLILHPQPKRVLIIGLGVGLSVYASLAHDVNVDVVELSPAVVRVNRSFERAFEDYRREHGRSVLSDPRVKVRIEDGRNFVLGTTQKYDVIQVGGFHPVITSG
ncbi:MAG: fused MFS/spermidine synthase, partial [Candidatus Brocadiae bacterium]|nr:fused MFS/spermidine synthase [Candidatus Brocadiia bacterium]